MQINFSPFPLLPRTSAEPGRHDQPGRVEQAERELRQQRQGRQAAEFVFQGDFEDEGLDARSARQVFGDSVHPLNRGAVLSYATTAATSFGQADRLGRHLDLFL